MLSACASGRTFPGAVLVSGEKASSHLYRRHFERTGRGIGVGMVLAVLASPGCSEYAAVAEHTANRVFENAVTSVRSELPAAQASSLELRITGTPNGSGFYIYSVDRSDNPEFVWVFVCDGHIYALGKEEHALTPRITLIEDAPDDLQRESGLAHLSRQEIVHDVASRSARGRYVSHPPSKKPA